MNCERMNDCPQAFTQQETDLKRVLIAREKCNAPVHVEETHTETRQALVDARSEATCPVASMSLVEYLSAEQRFRGSSLHADFESIIAQIF